MTATQKQLLLCFFGCLPVSGVDGIWGPQSQGATKDLQRRLGISETGNFDQHTEGEVLSAMVSGEIPTVSEKEPADTDAEDWWDEIEFFTREEFRCKCGGKYCNGFPAEPHEATVRFADEIRKRLGKPIPVNSGLRCPTWNRIQGGVSNSNHMNGGAADLGRPSGITSVQMKTIAEEVMGNTGGIGIYDWGIHIDDGVYSRWDERT